MSRNVPPASSASPAAPEVAITPQGSQALQVEPGDRVLFLLQNETVLLKPLAACSARALAGSLSRFVKGSPTGPARGRVKKEVARAAAQEG